MIERMCPQCGKMYLADPKRLKHGRQTTCSRECSYALRGAAKERSLSLTCQVCGKDFQRKPFEHRAKHVVVCSPDCYVKSRVLGMLPPLPRKPTIRFTCETCGKDVELPAAVRGARRNRFCSSECANKGNSGAGSPKWRGGHPHYYGPDWMPVRRAARERDNHTCRRCGKYSPPPSRALDVHHLKPVSAFPNVNEANTLGNVILLCHTCHMHIEWNGLDFTP